MSKKPEDSTSSEAPSPLDRVRDLVLGTAKKPVKWDIEEDDPVIRRLILQFVLNLVEQTPPNSKLAYKLCHFMEADHLSLPDLVKVVPTGRAAYKKAHKAYAEEKKNLRDQLMLARAEIRNLRAGVRAAPKGSAPELEAAIEAQKTAMAEFERDIATLEKGNEDYKESYPLMDTTKSRGSAVKEEDWEALRSYLRKAVAKPIPKLMNNYSIIIINQQAEFKPRRPS